ncbi:EamA family transporter [soil metagenome]
MPLRHFFIALAVVAIWGTNFVVVKIALDHVPPLLFAALRFLFALLPAVFFLPRPKVPLSNLAAYGVLNGVGQFGLMYLAIAGRISPGLASLVIQTQVFFTVGLSMLLAGETLKPFQYVALLAGAAGIAVIGAHTDANVTPTGLCLMIVAAMSWALANIANKRAGKVNMLAYVVWASAFAVPPLFVLSFWFEGSSAVVHALREAGPMDWAAVLWQSVGNTMFGYAAWGWLLSRYPASVVAPMALMVPLFGMGTASVVLGEALPAWKIWAASLILIGLVLNLLWPVIKRRLSLDLST